MIKNILSQEKYGRFAIIAYRCIDTINVMWLFLMVPWVGLQCVIVVYPDHTHLLLDVIQYNSWCVIISAVFCRVGSVVTNSLQ